MASADVIIKAHEQQLMAIVDTLEYELAEEVARNTDLKEENESLVKAFSLQESELNDLKAELKKVEERTAELKENVSDEARMVQQQIEGAKRELAEARELVERKKGTEEKEREEQLKLYQQSEDKRIKECSDELEAEVKLLKEKQGELDALKAKGFCPEEEHEKIANDLKERLSKVTTEMEEMDRRREECDRKLALLLGTKGHDEGGWGIWSVNVALSALQRELKEKQKNLRQKAIRDDIVSLKSREIEYWSKISELKMEIAQKLVTDVGHGPHEKEADNDIEEIMEVKEGEK